MSDDSGNITDMDKTTMKIWKSTRRKLKILAANSEMPMTRLLDYLVNKEILRRKNVNAGET